MVCYIEHCCFSGLQTLFNILKQIPVIGITRFFRTQQSSYFHLKAGAEPAPKRRCLVLEYRKVDEVQITAILKNYYNYQADINPLQFVVYYSFGKHKDCLNRGWCGRSVKLINQLRRVSRHRTRKVLLTSPLGVLHTNTALFREESHGDYSESARGIFYKTQRFV
jgi:hypothetical protein